MSRLAPIVCVALACFACSDRTPSSTTEPVVPGHVASTRGAAIVLSRDEHIAVAANRTAGVITVFGVDPSKDPEEVVTESIPPRELDTGAGSEPWAAGIGADDDTAYVVLRGRGLVQRVRNLRGGRAQLDGAAQVGAEPTAIAITPSGKYLFVANWGDGTISVLSTEPFEELPTRYRMYKELAESGVLGQVDARPGLAHPRALAMTDDDDLDDTDETLYATEFFSQPLPGVEETPDGAYVDRNRQAFVYSIPVSGRNAEGGEIIDLEPILETGFADAEGDMTSCFPNQLYAAAVDGSRLYVTTMCASPRGPVGGRDSAKNATPANFKTTVHPVIFEVDPATGAGAPVVLTRELEQLYAMDDPSSPARMPLIPNDIVFARDSTADGVRSAYVTALGADAVFRVDFDSNGTPRGIGSPNARFIDLHDASRSGQLPIGIALSAAASKPFALVLNDNSQNVSVVDRTTEKVVSVLRTTVGTDRAMDVFRSPENAGRKLFATGLDAWSLQGKAWSSCESCHPDGLSDGLTWFFARGPRRTISTAATYDGDDPVRRRVMLWTANIDEVHDVEVIARTVSGGVGGVLWSYEDPPSVDCRILYDGSPVSGSGNQPCGAPKPTTHLLNGLNGSLAQIVPGPVCALDAETCDGSAVDDWTNIDGFIQTVRAPYGPRIGPALTELPTADIDRGVRLFRQGRCAACHGGPGWTISKVFYTPGSDWNGALPYAAPATGVLALVGRLRASTYSVDSPLLRGLNPPAKNGSASLRLWAPMDGSDAAAHDYAYASATSANDQINCVLRSVGTFPTQPLPPDINFTGVVPPGAPGVLELRHDMKALALGESGFNVPSLLGLAAGAPYFHAGNARTLEEVFDPVFKAHYQAIVPEFLADTPDRPSQVHSLVSFLLSIGEATPWENVPADLGFEPILCPPPSD